MSGRTMDEVAQSLQTYGDLMEGTYSPRLNRIVTGDDISRAKTLLICGAGLSIHTHDFPIEFPIMGISSGALHVPEMTHFVSCDRPVHFPQWLVDSDRFQKHVPLNKWAGHWEQYANVSTWPVSDGHFPLFVGTPGFQGMALTQSGPLPRNHSLLFGVQVAAQLGYKSMHFIGCDLLEREHWPISDVLRSWYPLAREAGIEWVNLSPTSTLNEWMPTGAEMAVH